MKSFLTKTTSARNSLFSITILALCLLLNASIAQAQTCPTPTPTGTQYLGFRFFADLGDGSGSAFEPHQKASQLNSITSASDITAGAGAILTPGSHYISGPNQTATTFDITNVTGSSSFAAAITNNDYIFTNVVPTTKSFFTELSFASWQGDYTLGVAVFDGGTLTQLGTLVVPPTGGQQTLAFPTAYLMQPGRSYQIRFYFINATATTIWFDNPQYRFRASSAGLFAPTLSATSASNTCPATTINLTSITATNSVSGTTLTWHTGTPATAANKVSNPSAVTAGGTYYASFFDAGNNCYSNTSSAVTATLTDCADTDGDGILNSTDIDDDNDGVLDTVEGCDVSNLIIANGDFSQGYTGFQTTVNTVTGAYDPLNGIPAFGDATDWAGWDTAPGVRTPDGGNFMVSNNLAVELGVTQALYYKKVINVFPNANLEFQFDLNTDGIILDFLINGTSINGGPKVFDSRAAGQGAVVGTWKQYKIPFTVTGNSSTVTFEIITTNSNQYNPAIHGATTGNGIYDDAAIDNFKVNLTGGTCVIDTDGDGTPNQLDLDSDNDGCSDAFEAGTTTNKAPNYTQPGPYGANGFANALETASESGVYNGTYTYGNATNVAIKNCIVPGAGTIDCAKTQIFTAPVAGQAGQKTLIVSVNVTAAGCFSPLTVSGSGMTLANGVIQVCTSTTGVQTFTIPVNYDGTALGTLNFTVGAAGSCTADLTKIPKKAITDIWTLDCVPTVGPSLK